MKTFDHCCNVAEFGILEYYMSQIANFLFKLSFHPIFSVFSWRRFYSRALTACCIAARTRTSTLTTIRCRTNSQRHNWKILNRVLKKDEEGLGLALFDMPNSNRFDILSISIFSEISLSISISISIFSKISLSISISISIYSRTALSISISISIFSRIALSISIFSEWRYRYRYFPNLPIYRLSI